MIDEQKEANSKIFNDADECKDRASLLAKVVGPTDKRVKAEMTYYEQLASNQRKVEIDSTKNRHVGKLFESKDSYTFTAEASP